MELSRKKQIEKTYMKIAIEVANLSRCKRAKVGAVIVKDANIISFGYNGTPRGFCNKCEENNGETKKEVIHAEANAIIKAGNKSEGAYLFITLSPCIDCCKLIKQAGIKKVFFLKEYRDLSGLTKLKLKHEKIYL
jgi:dCMP deaminase